MPVVAPHLEVDVQVALADALDRVELKGTAVEDLKDERADRSEGAEADEERRRDAVRGQEICGARERLLLPFRARRRRQSAPPASMELRDP